MKKEPTKMCPSCEGVVSLDVSMCPYCGANVFEENPALVKENDFENSQKLSYEQTLESLYPPPYKPKAINSSSHFEEQQSEKQTIQEKELLQQEEKSALLPIILFWVGINMFVFSLILLIFSNNGELHLKWSSKYWYLYAIIALPIALFGFNQIKKID